MIGYSKKKREQSPAARVKNIILAWIFPIVFLIFWEWIVRAGYVKPTLIPPPSKVWSTFLTLIKTGKLQHGLGISFKRVIIGFFLGSISGAVIGFLMGLFAGFNRAVSVFVSVLRPIPTIALIPIFIILFGIGESSITAVILIGSFWPVLLNTMAGIQNVDPKLLELAYVYRVKNRKIIFKIVLPAALTSIFAGLRLSIGTAWMSVVGAEMIGASSGIGYMIMYARELAQAANMYVEVLVIGIIGLLIDRVLLFFQNRFNKRFLGIIE